MSDGHELKRYRLASIQVIAASAMVIGGLVLLVYYAGVKDTTGFWPILAGQLASVLLIGGIWTGFYELFQRRDFIDIQNSSVERIIDKIPDVDHFEEVGLCRTENHNSAFNYGDLIRYPQNLTIVINDGRTWVSNNIGDLERRFANKAQNTTFIFLHPYSTFIPNLTDKLGIDEESYRDKIAETVKLLVDVSSGKGNLRILGHRFFNPHTTFLTEGEAVVTPYYYSRARKVPPVFVYRQSGDDCYYSRIEADVRALELDCRDISNPKQLDMDPFR